MLGVDKPFHSLRHGVATRLREAGVPEDVVAELLGHARGTTESFQRYAKAASVKRLHDALCKLSYNAERS
jgi:integrase